jgi:hypothetical protein
MNLWDFEDRGGAYSARLRPAEREVLADVVGQVVELLGGDPDENRAEEHPLDRVRLGVGPVPAPTDPAVRRLLPDGSRGDAEIAAEFRRLTQDELRSTKVGALLRLHALLLGGPSDGLVVPPGEAAAVAAAMTDVRLVVAERLGVHTEEEADEVYRLANEPGNEPGIEPGNEPGIEPGADEDGPDLARRLLAVVSVVLGVLQDSLVELMLAAMPDDGVGASEPGRTDDPHDGPPDPTRAPR